MHVLMNLKRFLRRIHGTYNQLLLINVGILSKFRVAEFHPDNSTPSKIFGEIEGGHLEVEGATSLILTENVS